MNALFEQVEALTQAGQLRRLSGAFARFIATLGSAPPSLMLASVLLSELEGRGHSCLMLEELADPAALLGWEADAWRELAAAAAPLPTNVKAWVAQLSGCDQVWHVGDLDFDQPLVLDGERLYLRRYWRDEMLVAQTVAQRATSLREVDPHLVRGWIDILFGTERRADSHAGPDWQRLACAIALRGGMAIITGGPGTGKTYTVARLLALLLALAPDQRIALAAPTGKAAARLKQSIDKALGDLADKVGGALPLRELTARMGPARTLHSLLGARPDTRSFAHHKGNPLDVDVLIVDEASMVHLEMMACLLDALPPGATLVLLGDKDQLASVEAGAVLGDLCRHAEDGGYSAATLAYAEAATGEAIPPDYAGNAGALAQQTVMLRQSRRFGGPIGQLALAVNCGDVVRAEAVLRGPELPVEWFEHAHQRQVVQLGEDGYFRYLNWIKEGPRHRTHELWAAMALQSFEGFRILCAVREGEWGVTGLNEAIEQRLDAMGLIRRRGEWYVGRPVMITRNDYGTGVFNGDIGLTLPDPERPGSLRVYFLEGERVRSVLATRLRHVETAYAMTVHKSQGSEFRHTVLVLPKERGAMIARELVYTGITRASERFTLVSAGSGVLGEAIVRRTQRASGLREMIAQR